MRATPQRAWICRTYLSRIAKPSLGRHVRFHISGMHHLPFMIFFFENLLTIAQASTSESIPPALLARARTVAVEHKELTEKLANGFDARAAKKLGGSSAIVNALREWEKANEVSQRHGTALRALYCYIIY